jgi:putative ABC transport system ATP-binding protein
MLLLENVKKSYLEPSGRELPILDIPHFEVAAGEQMTIVGRSGCGKTTLLHVIAGITRATSGRVMIDRINLASLSEAGADRLRADKIGYVFQTFNLLPAFSAWENVVLGATFCLHKQRKNRALELLERVGLAHRATHRPAALSVGEQQRVAVARALAKNPKLLLADEPTANVDPANQQQIVELIRRTCEEEQITLVMVTHSEEVAAQFERCDKLQEINRVGGEGNSNTKIRNPK